MKILTKKCIVCGKKFIKKSNCSKKNWTLSRFCSRKCINIRRKPWNANKKTGIVTRGIFRKGHIAWNKDLKGTHFSTKTEFKKGNIPWHIGTRGIKKGHKWTEEEKKEIAKRTSGPKSHFWKGGLSKESYRLRRTARYNDFRKSVYERDNYTCQECKNRGGRLQVHHIKSWAKYPKLRFEISNGQTLCISCHIQTDSYAKNFK